VKALANFGYEPLPDVTAMLELAQDRIAFPGELGFRIQLSNVGADTRTVLVDYAIHHQKKDGSLTPKVFKGKRLVLGAGERVTIDKRHALRPITTRVYHPGLHRLEILLNGVSVAASDFRLDLSEHKTS
jgi:hypothetical protein